MVVGRGARRYCLSLRAGLLSQPLIVFLDTLVRRAISLIDSPSRSRSRRTFAYIAMVCTSPSQQSWNGQNTRSIFSEQNVDFLVSVQRAATAMVVALLRTGRWHPS
jgi:hypothetical protein